MINNSYLTGVSVFVNVHWCVGIDSLVFGNIVVYFLFAGETFITAESRTVLFIILTAAAVAGCLLMILFCQRPTSEADVV